MKFNQSAPVSAKSGDAKRAEESAEFFVGKVRRENRRCEAASPYRSKNQDFKNATGASATRSRSEARLAWPQRSEGNQDAREDAPIISPRSPLRPPPLGISIWQNEKTENCETADRRKEAALALAFSELGAGRSKDGLDQDDPAT